MFLDRGSFDHVNALLEHDSIRLLLPVLVPLHPVLDMALRSAMSDLINSPNSLQCLLSKVSVVSFWPVSLPLKLKRSILCHILSMQSSVGLGPFHLARIPLHLKVLVTLGSTESKYLCIIAHKLDPMTRVYSRGAEPALF